MEPDGVDGRRRPRSARGGSPHRARVELLGRHRYPHDLFDELFDGVVISGEEGMRKPSRRMYELGAERAGLDAELCVYVDDLPFNLPPAEKLGMATVHHTSAETTIPRARAAPRHPAAAEAPGTRLSRASRGRTGT